MAKRKVVLSGPWQERCFLGQTPACHLRGHLGYFAEDPLPAPVLVM